MHKHHIMPRHLGGTDNPENLVEVSVEEHAEIHRCLWVYGGRWQDKTAWWVLSGQVGKDEIMREIRRQNGKLVGSRPKSKKHRQNISKAWTEEKRRAKSLSQRGEKNPNYNVPGRVSPLMGRKRPEQSTVASNVNMKMLKAGTHPSQRIVTCPYCKFETGIGNAKRHHFDNCREKKNATKN